MGSGRDASPGFQRYGDDARLGLASRHGVKPRDDTACEHVEPVLQAGQHELCRECVNGEHDMDLVDRLPGLPQRPSRPGECHDDLGRHIAKRGEVLLETLHPPLDHGRPCRVRHDLHGDLAGLRLELVEDGIDELDDSAVADGQQAAQHGASSLWFPDALGEGENRAGAGKGVIALERPVQGIRPSRGRHHGHVRVVAQERQQGVGQATTLPEVPGIVAIADVAGHAQGGTPRARVEIRGRIAAPLTRQAERLAQGEKDVRRESTGRLAHFVAATLVMLVGAGAVWAQQVDPDLRADLQQRRARLMASLDATTMFIAWSAPAQVYSRDVDYEYRQDSNLLYLTGVSQEHTILVLMPGNVRTREILFVSEPNARREHWVGHLLTKEEAAAATGIEKVFYTSQFEAFVTAMFNRQAYDVPRGDDTDEFDAFFDAVRDARVKMALVFGPRPAPSEELTRPYEFASRVRDRFVGVAFEDATPIVENLRQVKTPYEQRILSRSLEISSDAHMAGMRTAAPGKYEYEVEAAIEQVYLTKGAMSWGYPSIVGSGPNATILHYGASSRKMEAGDLLLVDAAANYRSMSGDITRTYPVSGTFSPAQRELYQVVLDAQEAGMRAARVGNRTKDVERAVSEAVNAGLTRLGLVTDATTRQFRTWYTHGVCHWIGMDVHDAGDYDRPLEPGMAFVIEPGVYIRPGALDQLEDTPENRAFKEKVRPALEKYQGMGIRIEDSFLLTESGLVRLSARVPRTVEEIERFMR